MVQVWWKEVEGVSPGPLGRCGLKGRQESVNGLARGQQEDALGRGSSF